MFVQIKDFPDYAVDDSGNVYSLVQRTSTKQYPRWLQLKPEVTHNGYLTVALYLSGKVHRRRIHRLVMEAFTGPSDLFVNHKNADKADNRLENLEYCTHTENCKHALENGLYLQGQRHPRARLTAEQVAEIRRFKKTKTAKELADIYGVSAAYVFKLWQGRCW